jgi:hypothetical protein
MEALARPRRPLSPVQFDAHSWVSRTRYVNYLLVLVISEHWPIANNFPV